MILYAAKQFSFRNALDFSGVARDLTGGFLCVLFLTKKMFLLK